MSHFTVLVIGSDPEAQLAPYHEFECTGVDDQYVVDVDKTDKVRADYDAASGMSLVEWASDYYGWPVKKASDPRSEAHTYGFIEVDDAGELVRAVDRTNPQKKWDWYQLGGRWTGFFKLKKGANGEVGSPGLMTSQAKPGYADAVRKGDVDWAGMITDTVNERLLRFDAALAIIEKYGRPRPWKDILAEYGEDKINDARAVYGTQPAVAALRKAHLDPWSATLEEEYTNFDRDAFIAVNSKTAVHTHAVVKDGKWYEKGEMGFFGVCHDEMTDDQWDVEFQKLIDGLPEDTLLSVYDCHI